MPPLGAGQTFPERLAITLRIAPDNLAEVRTTLAEVVRKFTSDTLATHHVLLALDEAVQNILRYGYRAEELPGRLDVKAWRQGDDLVVELRDYAKPADLSRIRPRIWDPERPGGLGLPLMLASMDEVRYTHAPEGSGNILVMRKRLG